MTQKYIAVRQQSRKEMVEYCRKLERDAAEKVAALRAQKRDVAEKVAALRAQNKKLREALEMLWEGGLKDTRAGTGPGTVKVFNTERWFQVQQALAMEEL